MALKKFLMVGIVAAVLEACSDDGSSVTNSGEDSSSSSAVSSSSVFEGYVDPSTVVKGTMTDERDGQTYKTVKIGTQTWMAENLNYAYIGFPYKYEKNNEEYISDSASWCYVNDAANCAKYGRLYTWAAAMDSVGTWTANGKGCGSYGTCEPEGMVRGVCPEGWHMPDSTEWETLFIAVGGQSIAGKMLKSTSGWNNSGNGTDAFGFSSLPVGDWTNDGYFGVDNFSTTFWSASEYKTLSAYSIYLYYSENNANLFFLDKRAGFSVRCVKD